MALLREKGFKQRIQIIWINTETYLHFLDYPNSGQIHLLYFHLAHVKFQTHVKDLLSQICRIPHNPSSSHCFTRWTFCTHFEIHVKKMALYKVVPKEKIS